MDGPFCLSKVPGRNVGGESDIYSIISHAISAITEHQPL
jgi:hypothetical protein